MTASGTEFRGRALTSGSACGAWIELAEPLSFWGGVDAEGRVIDVHHPQSGTTLTGKVVGMGSGRGSSSAAAVLAEQIRTGHSPAAVVMTECDTILVVGALVAAELYDRHMPIVQVDESVFARLDGRVTVRVDGTMTATLTTRV
jgi:predicted aconitase with swiveling domain